MEKSDVGLMGLGVMGANLALNLESKGHRVAVYNRTKSVTEEFVRQNEGTKLTAAGSVEQFVLSLEKPRVIFVMVTAGAPVDAVVAELVPLLDQGDAVVDAGNSFFKDTMRRERLLAGKGMSFVGLGVSGGAEGALKGPSIMGGASPEAWSRVGPLLEGIAARAFDATPCSARVGPDGAGHYVKMVHNAIEYVDMQLIGEAYHAFLAAGMTNEQIASAFSRWNRGDLGSYLVEITARVLRKKDRLTGRNLVDMVLDTAEQKGTGRWATESAMELGVPAYSMAAAVMTRYMSSLKGERSAAESLGGRQRAKAAVDMDQLHDALYASKVCAYAQGFQLISAASKEYGWGIEPATVAHVWQGGCIIRAKLLADVEEAFLKGDRPKNLLLDPKLMAAVKRCEEGWRGAVSKAVKANLPVPALSSSLAYYDSYFCARLPANLLQAQRDYFGAHTYRRTDVDGTFHTEWEKD
ncbi:MAG: NADP-dependent phosphogluconate dehydrogenase [Nitrososphaerota archaeon]|nr:NADP-dependent phosphogluconate dehydrogenase [Nitrososphaerota archaeon]